MAGVLLPTDDSIQAVKDIIGFKFHDRALLREALQAAGFASTDGNKKLALLGDAVLKPVLVMEGFANSRGVISKFISFQASNAHLAEQGYITGLDRYICTHPLHTQFVPKGVMATTMEAIIGAVFLDSGCNYFVIQEVMATSGLSWPE